ncbi:cytochrome P450, partial [Ramicandelaber brevisporus]
PELYHEFVRAPDRLLSLPRAFGHFLMLDQQFGYDAWKDQIQVPVIRLEANHNLDTFNERLERWMTFELDRQVGPLAKGETKVVRKVEHLVELVFGRASAACLVGDELAANDELLDSFIDMGVCVSRGTKIARVLPEFITKPLIRRLSGFQRHIEVFERIVVPEIEKRRREAREAFEQGVEFVRPHDIMQSLLEVPDDEGNERPADQISRTLMSMVFAAIHTTANTGANLIFDTTGRANIMQAIIEEQHKLGTVSTASVDMPLLDACIRETMRTNSFQVVPMRRAMQDLTFSNGMQVPEGRICISVTTDAHVNPDIHPQPFKYDPYRFVNVPRKSATTVSRDFRHFGGGRNACPGRFFAVHEMKMMMVLILRKYAIRTVSGTRRP